MLAIVYKAADSSPVNLITRLTSKPVTIMSAEGIAASLQDILQRVADRQYVTFAGYDKAAKVGLAGSSDHASVPDPRE